MFPPPTSDGRRQRQWCRPTTRGFTLVEVLVGLAVFLVLLVLMVNLASQAMEIWQDGEDQKTRQQAARLAFQRMNRELEGAAFPLSPENKDRFFFLVNPGFSSLENPEAIFWQTMSSGDGTRGDVVEVGYFVRWREVNGKPVAELCRVEVPPEAADSILSDPAQVMSPAKIDRYAPTSTDTNNPMKGILASNVVGLWVQLYDGIDSIATPYDLNFATVTPSTAEISLALMDSRTANRIESASDITAHYKSTPSEFLEALPDHLRQGIRILTIRSRLEASQP